MSFLDKLKGWLGIGAASKPERAAEPKAENEDEDEDADERAAEDEDEQPVAAVAGGHESEVAAKRRAKTRAKRKNDTELEAEARALFAEDRSSALSLLRTRATLLAKHEPTSLPCLCKECLRPELDTAESGGIAYVRDFVVMWHRVLFYWTPAELASDAKQVRASMRSELRRHLRALANHDYDATEMHNPFTQQVDTRPPKDQRRPRINPFTGKPVK